MYILILGDGRSLFKEDNRKINLYLNGATVNNETAILVYIRREER